MPSRGPKSGRKCYVTPEFLGVPNKAEQNQNWLPQPCLLGGRKVGRSAMSPLHSRGSPPKGDKIRIGCLNHAFSRAHKWAKVLRQPCILRRPQQRGTKSELATSAMPSRKPKSGRKCYVTPAFSGVPNKGEQNQNWLPRPCLLGGPKVGGTATSPLHSRGSPSKGNKIRIGCLRHAFWEAQKWVEVLRHPCILGGLQQRATKSEQTPSAMPSRGPKSGRKCYVTPAFSEVPTKGGPNQNWRPQPCLLAVPKVGGSAPSPLNSQGSPTKGNKIRIDCLSHAFSGAQKWAEVLRHPCILGGPHQRGTKSELAASAMPSRGPKSGWKCYVTPAFSGVPNKGEQNQNWLPQPCLLAGPKEGGSAMSPLHFGGSQTKGNIFRFGCLSHAFSGAQSRAKVLRHPCILGGPQQRGTKSELVASAMPPQGPKSGRKCYVTPAFSAFSNKGEQNQNWLPQPCLLAGPKVGGSAMSPLHSQASPTKGNIIRIGCLSHASSGAQKWAEVVRHPCILGGLQQRGTKSELAASAMPSRGPKSGWKCYVTPAFSGVPNKGEQRKELAASAMPSQGPECGRKCYVTPAFLGVPNKGNQNRNWLPQPCLLGGPKVGGSATSHLHSRGSPPEGNKIRIGCLSHAFSRAQKRAELLCHPCILGGPKQRGTYSELAAPAMPSQWPKTWRKCYVTPPFSGVPNKGEPKSELAASPLHSRGPKLREPRSELAASTMPCRGPKSGWKCYVTPAFSGVPNKGEPK